MKATKEQQLIIDSGLVGNNIVRSVSGSGKSSVMVEAISKLIESGVDSNRILFITFSKTASEDMESKLLNRVGRNTVHVSTIHSLLFQVLRSHTRKRYSVIKPWDKEKLLQEISGSKNVNDIELMIDVFKSNILRVDEDPYENDFFANLKLIDKDHLYKVFVEYEKRKQKLSKRGEIVIDFIDMIYLTYLNLIEDESLQEKVNNMFDYVIIDEFQDTSRLQMKALAYFAENNNFTVVGDEKQNIYGFAGASLDIMRNFKGNEYRLSKTFRNRPQITMWANKVASNIDNMITESFFDDEDTADIRVFDCDRSEAEWIVSQINPERETFVLYRTNKQSLWVEIELLKKGVNYTTGKGSSFFSMSIVRSIFNYLMLQFGTDAEKMKALNVIKDVPNRYLGNSFYLQARKHYYENKCFEDIYYGNYNRRGMERGINDLRVTLEQLSEHDSPYDWLQDLLYSHGVYDHYESKLTGVTSDLLNEICGTLGYLFDSMSFEKLIEIYKRVISNCDETKITLSSIHKSKGLEADDVFVIGNNSGTLPHAKAPKDEELRLFYVAITRARFNLMLTTTRLTQGKRTFPSPFLSIVEEDFKDNEQKYYNKI